MQLRLHLNCMERVGLKLLNAPDMDKIGREQETGDHPSIDRGRRRLISRQAETKACLDEVGYYLDDDESYSI
jgi:hypothetical protein